jgi:hypothetical protein
MDFFPCWRHSIAGLLLVVYAHPKPFSLSLSSLDGPDWLPLEAPPLLDGPELTWLAMPLLADCFPLALPLLDGPD